MPKTERSETLKTYGDAPVTVSVSITTSALDAFPVAVRFFLNVGRRYVNFLGSVASTL